MTHRPLPPVRVSGERFLCDRFRHDAGGRGNVPVSHGAKGEQAMTDNPTADEARLRKLHDDAVIAACHWNSNPCERTRDRLNFCETAFREALFAAFQPDAGAMAEARELAHDVLRQHFGPFNVDGHLCDLLESAIAIYAARREAAGFARGCEEAAKATESWFAEWSPKDAMNGRMCSAAIRTLASAGRALLGEGKE
jgi:hypothetical protein